jgi:ATP-dependent 26S proteasome regulatory subunit
MEIERLAITSENFSGAEIEAAVNEAAIRAFDEDRYPEIDLDDINAAINSTVPLAKSYQKKVEGLREWAKIARPASLTEPERTVKRTSNYLN